MKDTFKGKAILLAVVIIVVGAFKSASAQTPPANSAQDVQPQAGQTPNLQTELNLTPEQIEKWRALNRELRDEEQAAGLRLRHARRALADAMESPNPSEELIKQRAKELADAQSAITQQQALRQARVLQLLTPEQRIKLREIRKAQATMRERNQRDGQRNLNGLNQRRGVPRNANIQTLTPRERRVLRQQQRKP
jgi:Spy/CpxP family protein refolding chaperone